MSDQNINILKRFLPEPIAVTMGKWIDHFQVELTITKPRESVLGDYRPPHSGKGHRISINANLNQYSFMITLIHEFAHLTNWNKYGNRVKPHGEEWKMEYKRLMQPFLDNATFPEKIAHAVQRYMRDPAASSCTDTHLLKVLKEFDAVQQTIFVQSIPTGSYFQMRNGKVFQKLSLIRKRYKCKELHTGAIYLFSPVSEVIPVDVFVE